MSERPKHLANWFASSMPADAVRFEAASEKAWESIEVDARRLFLPRKLEAQAVEIKVLKSSVAKLRKKIDQRHGRAAQLGVWLRNIKMATKHRRMSQLQLAEILDAQLRKHGKLLLSVAPHTWKKYGLPATLTLVLSAPKADPKSPSERLKRLAKTYISKA